MLLVQQHPLVPPAASLSLTPDSGVRLELMAVIEKKRRRKEITTIEAKVCVRSENFLGRIKHNNIDWVTPWSSFEVF